MPAYACNSHPQKLTQADLMPSPDDGLNMQLQLSVEVGVTYGRGCVTIDIQLLVSLLNGCRGTLN
jgi:hypothetical protein